jgi:lipoprotein signal peptidase
MNKKITFYGLTCAPGLLALTLDQVTKFFSPTTVLNQDISFSWPLLSQTKNVQAILLAVLLIGMAVFARWHLRSQPNFFTRVSYSVLLGAAFSNWLDRMICSGVRDIWEVPFLGLRNNLADWLIVFSVVTIIGVDWLQHISLAKHPAEIAQ